MELEEKLEQVERLARLRDDGYLTEKEFDSAKATIFSSRIRPMALARETSVDSTFEEQRHPVRYGVVGHRRWIVLAFIVAAFAFAGYMLLRSGPGILPARRIAAQATRAAATSPLTNARMPSLPEPVNIRETPIDRELIPSSDTPNDLCNAVVLKRVAARENPDSFVDVGHQEDSVTQYLLDENGDDFFCSHGGYCYPVNRNVEGVETHYLRLTNCEVDKTSGQIDGAEKRFGLRLIKDKFTEKELLTNDVYTLLEDKMSLPAARAAAYAYIHHPRSKCALTAGLALRNDENAIASLENGKICS